MKIEIADIAEWEALRGDQLPRLRQIVAVEDGKILGKVKLAGRAICEAALASEFPSTPMVYQLYVNEQMRGKGIGSALMDVVERLAVADGDGEILLCVMPDNSIARNMYERRGYTYIGSDTVESTWHLNGGTKHVQLIPMRKELSGKYHDLELVDPLEYADLLNGFSQNPRR